jgi:glycerol-3-phosphate dehydrogenase (NAD(P)+)
MKVCVLGAGAWGTALAKLLADKGDDTTIWAHEPAVADAINELHENTQYFAGVPLPHSISATNDQERALAGAELVVLVPPSHALRDVMTNAKPFIPRSALVCSATKGIENESLMLMSEVLVDVLGKEAEPRLTYISGPSFAREVAARMPTAVVVAGTSEESTLAVQRALATDRFRPYSSDDVIGVEVGGALKNVIAIAAGAIDGLGFGHNSRAGLITRGLTEIGRLAATKGGNLLTVAGLSGLGDLVLTCTGDLSRNRTVGLELGKGRKLPEILATLGHVAEGVKTAKSAYDLGIKQGIQMPITTSVYQVLYQGKDPRQAVVDIMTRALTKEW